MVVLAELARARSYGYDLVDRLRTAGLDDLSEATVYGTLRRLDDSRMLRSVLEPSSDGPARRYYEVTAAGRRRHHELVEQWQTFSATVDDLVRARNPRKQGRTA